MAALSTALFAVGVLLGGAPAMAQGDHAQVVGTVYYEEQPNPRVRVTFVVFPDVALTSNFHTVLLEPVTGGEGQLPHFVALDEIEADGRYRVETEPTVPGVYDIVVQTHYTNGGVQTTRQRLTVERPPSAVTVTVSGEGAIIRWTGGFLRPAGGYDVNVIDSVQLITTNVSADVNALVVPFVAPGETLRVSVGALHDPLNPHNSNVPTTLTSPIVTYVQPTPPPAPPGQPAGVDPTPEQIADLVGPPTITINAPLQVNRYVPAFFDFTCVDITVASCTADLERGARIPTSERGAHTYTVSAADAVGNRTTKSITIITDWKLPAPYAGLGGSRGVIARYYVATFGRMPDPTGFAYWSAEIDRDPANTAAAAWVFVNSAEYRQTYGSLGNADFVEQMYLNVLGRGPDPTGRAYWVGLLDAGSDRGDVMHAFTNSEEHKEITGTL